MQSYKFITRFCATLEIFNNFAAKIQIILEFKQPQTIILQKMELVSLEPETRNGYLVSAKMKKIWNIQLDMFQKLIELCKANNLRLWCDGGTLLGAVRHKGYIPWDDDMDICMPRPDFDRLGEIAPEYFKEPYFYQTAKTDVHYPRDHAQLRRSDTAAIRPSDCYRPFNQGIFIDIFPIEGCPDDPGKVRKVVKLSVRRMKELKSIDYPIFWSGRLGLVFRKYHWRRKVARYGFYNLYKPVEDLLRTCPWNSCRRVAQLGIDGDRFIFDKSIFDKTLWVPFENMTVPIPAGYDKFLRTQYGDDYMTPVMAPTNHGELILDPDHSYKELMPKVRREYRKSLLKRLEKKL